MEMNVNREFNQKQRDALKEIITELENNKLASDITYYVGYWNENNDFVVSESKSESEESHDWLNYYWAEYTNRKENIRYRITMYYKDFDHGSGNIHVLPGAIQVWKNNSHCVSGDDGFCEKDLSEYKTKRDGSISYSMIGGKPYCEYGWEPLLKSAVFWNEDILKELIECIKNDKVRCYSNSICSNEFYKDVKGYSQNGRCGHYIKYSIFRFRECTLYYKTVLIQGIGYFTKFDGEKDDFEPGNNVNTCGPNYIDETNGRWVIINKWVQNPSYR